MTLPRQPLTYCSYAPAEGQARVLILDGALDPIAAGLRARELRLSPGGQLLAFPVPPQIEEWEYQAYLTNKNRLIDLEEAEELFSAKTLEEWEEDVAREDLPTSYRKHSL